MQSFISVKDIVNDLVGIVIVYLKLLHYSRFVFPVMSKTILLVPLNMILKMIIITTHYLKSALAIMPIFVKILQHLK